MYEMIQPVSGARRPTHGGCRPLAEGHQAVRTSNLHGSFLKETLAEAEQREIWLVSEVFLCLTPNTGAVNS